LFFGVVAMKIDGDLLGRASADDGKAEKSKLKNLRQDRASRWSDRHRALLRWVPRG